MAIVTTSKFDIYPPSTLDDDDDVGGLCDQVFRHGCIIVHLGPGFQGTYEVAIRGEENKVRAYLNEVGWGIDQGYEWVVEGEQTETYNFLKVRLD